MGRRCVQLHPQYLLSAGLWFVCCFLIFPAFMERLPWFLIRAPCSLIPPLLYTRETRSTVIFLQCNRGGLSTFLQA